MLGKISDEIILKYDSQIPRYTSYPTAPQFNSSVDAKVYASWLEQLPEDENLSLYIHIPFCQQLCWYCGCYTKVTHRYAPVENYAHLLLREIRIVADLLKSKKRKVSHIHFGGGSPTILLPSDFQILMDLLKERFSLSTDAEIAIEIDPRNVNEKKISTYAKNGVNRVSIGVQDFNSEVQEAINRKQSFEEVYDCVKLFRKYGIEAINLDLIYGLPKQTVEMVKRNIDYALLLNPSRLALFSYAHVQWKKKHMRLIDEADLPQAKEKIEMYRTASQKLEENGYFSIGIDHFAKRDDSIFTAFCEKNIKRNFQGYSSDQGSSIIAFGVSAISQTTFGYAQNTLDFAEYEKALLANNLGSAKGIKFGQEDKMRKKIIDDLMCYMEVDLNKICRDFNLPQNYFDKEISALEALRKDGLLRIKNNVIKINLIAPQIARVVGSFFDQFFSPSLARHSRVA